jgi:hypothetical protein
MIVNLSNHRSVVLSEVNGKSDMLVLLVDKRQEYFSLDAPFITTVARVRKCCAFNDDDAMKVIRAMLQML